MTTPWYALNVSQPFKWSPSATHAHSGIDLATGVGRPITAPFDGVQAGQGEEPWGGQENEKVVDTEGRTHILSWLHMESFTPIAPGSPIHAGELLGYSGDPPRKYGNGPHIHFEDTVGDLAPYVTSYNPWRPTHSNYPVDPAPVLSQLKRTGEGGVMGGAGTGISGDYFSTSAGGGPDPFGIGAAFAGFEQSVATDVADVKKGVTDALKRAGVFLVALVLVIVGFVIISQPTAEKVAAGVKSKIEGAAGISSKAATGGGGGRSALHTQAGGGGSAVSEAAELA